MAFSLALRFITKKSKADRHVQELAITKNHLTPPSRTPLIYITTTEVYRNVQVFPTRPFRALHFASLRSN